MQRIVDKYKNMSKEEKCDMVKKVTVGAGLTTLGLIIGKSLKNKRYEDEIEYLNENIGCLESDNFYLEEVIDRQTLRMKSYIDDKEDCSTLVKELENEVKERDLSIMELVDGNEDRYRGIRSNVWSDEEIVKNASKLDMDTKIAKHDYERYLMSV